MRAAKAMVATALMLAAGVAHAGDSAKMVLDLRTGARESGGDETLTFSSLWDGGADATVTIAQDGVAIAANLAGEGERAWRVPYNGTYELTHTTYANGVAGKAETATFVVTGKAEPPEITDVVATPSEPWDGRVSISFNVVNSPAAACPDWNQPYLSIVATDNTTGSNYVSVAAALSGDTDAAGNGHAVTWDFKAQGLDFASPDVTFTVAYLKMPDWCVIDLSGGKDAAHYPVTYVSNVPNVPNVPTVPNVPGGTFNTDAYKTTKLVMRLIGPESDSARPFYCAIFETTQKQWELVTGNRPSHFKNDADSPMRPVEKVSWDRIRGDDFLGALRQKTGLDALDLPTEAQWEYACRAGTTTQYSYGDTANGDYMWFAGNSTDQTHAVGTKRPNVWGLYDMHGNVWEWCLDLYDPELSNRVERGGSWYFSADFCTSSSRSDILQSYGYHDLGFRLVRTLSNNLEGECSAEAVAGAERAGTVCAGKSAAVALGLPSSSSVEFDAAAYSADEGETLEFEVAVKGVNAAMPSRVAVCLSYLTAAATDLDLANGAIDGVTPKGGLKFPLLLTWDAGDTAPKKISIPVKADKAVECDETFVLQLAEFVGISPGETDICMVTVKDPSFDALREKIEAGTATKAESNTWNKVSHDGVPYMCGLAYPADGGKVKGSGYCPAGKKVTLKATASKNFAFVGWTSGVRGAPALPDGEYVATTPTLVIDRSAKPAKDTKTSTTISNLTEAATFYAVFEGNPLASAIPVVDDGGVVRVNYDAGKVTGAGRYAPGKKVTLKATANKGFAFSGFFDAEGNLLDETRSASLSFEIGDEDVPLTARFVTVDADQGSIVASLNGAAMPSSPDGSPAVATNVWCGVYLEWPLESEALSQTTVKVSGLPSGLKFTAKDIVDSKTKQVTVPANTIYGAPTAASKTGKDGKPTPSTVKVTVTTAGKSSATYEIALTVDPLPEWAVGNFDGAVGALPNGTVSLTIATSGKISGKILEGGKTWSLSASSFDEALSPKSEVGSPVFTATVIAKAGKEVATNVVTVAADAARPESAPYQCGVATGTSQLFNLSTLQPFNLSWTAWQNLWKRTDTKAKQPVFKKNIDVEYYPLGASGNKNNTVKFTFKKDGAVSFSGKINGVSVSGSAQIVWDGKGWKMTVYAPPKKGFEGWCETFDVTLTKDAQNIVTAVELGGEEPEMVQLWEGGPFWATKNIGAEKPEDSGYYFWWGDTIGYKWENEQWVASDGSVSGFSFSGSNTLTWNKDLTALQSEGWITSDGVLAPEHDAAHEHWGGNWRMPTYQEVSNIVEMCDWEESTKNGVNGWIVHGRGDYSANSIFLPWVGSTSGTSLYDFGSFGYYWSSIPDSGDYGACASYFTSGYYGTYREDRDYGLPIRPVQSPAE